MSYLRVSTQRQGISGLGLEAQRAAVARFVGLADELVAEYVEVESGKRFDRPQLAAALAQAKAVGAVLLIAKLDRLARNVAFIANLLEAGVDIKAVDLPEANRFVLHIMAAVAEQEAKAISERTKVALAAARERGAKLGWANPHRSDVDRAVLSSVTTRRATADAFALRHGPMLAERRIRGETLADIAADMNRRGIPSARGGSWHPATVSTLLRRHAKLLEPSCAAEMVEPPVR